jgi:hypothetical protein
VTAWEVNWIHGVKQPFHRHKYDMAGVYLRFGEITVTQPDGTASAPGKPFEVPRPYYQPKGITHREEANGKPGDPERLAIMFDLKDLMVPPLPMPSGSMSAFPREGAKNVLENERVRMWDYTWPSTSVGPFLFALDSIEVYVTAGTLRIRTPDGKEEVRQVAPKQARFISRGRVEAQSAVGPGPRAIVIELK